MKLDTYEKRTKHNVSDVTMKTRMSALKNLEDFIGEGEPTVDDVEEWVDHMIERYEDGDIKASSIHQYFNSIKYYFDTIHGDNRDITHMQQWLPKPSTDHGDFLTEDEWKQFIGSIYNYRDRAIFLLMYEYARRPGEIRLLNEEDIGYDEDEDVHTITFTILKKQRTTDGNEFRATFNLKDNCKSALDQYMDKYERGDHEEIKQIEDEEKTVHPLFTTSHGRISYDSIYKMSKKYARQAGIDSNKNIMPKTMRHTRATHLDWAGFEPGEIARHQLVHGPNTQVISAYIHDRSEDQVREVMDIEDE